jgi:hypothetical protein
MAILRTKIDTAYANGTNYNIHKMRGTFIWGLKRKSGYPYRIYVLI